MPRRKFIDKKTATTFSLVYRAQNDPLIHDPSASDMVFTEKPAANASRSSAPVDLDDSTPPTSSAASTASAKYSAASSKSKIARRGELDAEFADSVRQNEGEAAAHGIYYDDSKYDYMQHLRELGSGAGGAVFIEAKIQGQQKRENKGKKSAAGISLRQLSSALDASLADNDDAVSFADSTASTSSRAMELGVPQEMLPSEFVQRQTYQNMQDVPDSIRGLRPDMDPRLREVLEALEDEAYVDDDESLFEELAGDGGEEVDEQSWGEGQWEDDEEGWESDNTVRAGDGGKGKERADMPEIGPDEGWMDEFRRFKKDEKTHGKEVARVKFAGLDDKNSESCTAHSTANTDTSGLSRLRRKKRKGALTSSTGYSMTSSVLARTEALSVLDAKFDRIQGEYFAEDDEEVEMDNDSTSVASGLSGLSGLSKQSKVDSQAPRLVRADFDNIMDDFLGSYQEVGRRRVKRGKPASGLAQLEEVRRELGPARVKT